MSEKRVYEIARKLSDKDNLEKDMEEAFGLVAQHFKNKYLERLNTAFNKCRENSANNPSKELRLVQAIKPFLPEERHEKIDEMAQMLTVLSTFENIRKEAVQVESSAVEAQIKSPKIDPAIHEDGIYEVDELCMLRKQKGRGPDFAGLMLVMGLMGRSAAQNTKN